MRPMAQENLLDYFAIINYNLAKVPSKINECILLFNKLSGTSSILYGNICWWSEVVDAHAQCPKLDAQKSPGNAQVAICQEL